MQIFINICIVRFLVAPRQREKFEILVFSGGQGDANFHSMYIVHFTIFFWPRLSMVTTAENTTTTAEPLSPLKFWEKIATAEMTILFFLITPKIQQLVTVWVGVNTKRVYPSWF